MSAKILQQTTIALLALTWAPAAFAQEPAKCPMPVAPTPIQVTMPEKPVQPATPPCVSTNKCKKAEADAYNAGLDRYNNAATAYNEAAQANVVQVNQYIKLLNAFNVAIQAYAKCEHDRVVVAVDGA